MREIAFVVEFPIFNRVERHIMPTPRQRNRDKALGTALRFWKWIAADPRFAIFGIDVTHGI